MSRPKVAYSHNLILKVLPILAACLFLLFLTSTHNSAQQQGQQPAQKERVIQIEIMPTPTPTPGPTPDALAVYEQATNCVLVPGVKLSSDPDQVLVKCTIKTGTHFKVKASGKISSSTAREGDFVAFEVAETVRSSIDERVRVPIEYVDTSVQRGRTVIEKSAPAFGVVLNRKHRQFPMVNGKLNVSLGIVTAIDGTSIPVYIDRFRCQACLECLIKTGKDCKEVCTWPSLNEKWRKPKSLCDKPAPGYVSGRADRNVAVVVQALALTALAFVNNRDHPAEKAFILFTLATQSGVGDLLNGSDAEIQAGDVFDAYVTSDTDVILNVTKPVFSRRPARN